MPQLNPYPWFALFIATWMIFLGLVIPKTLSHTSSPNPAPNSLQRPTTSPWLWPWA